MLAVASAPPFMSSTVSRLQSSVQAARSAHPTLSVSDREFKTFLAHRLDATDLDEDSAAKHAVDLLLVCALLRGDPRAILVFETAVLATLDGRLTRIVGAASLDEVKQRVRAELLVAKAAAPPGIAAYVGRAPLRTWVRSVAVNIALKLKSEQGRTRPIELDDIGAYDNPALRLLRDQYADAYRTAFELALRALDRRERTLLRQQFVDGLGTEALAGLYGVHRVTMFRRLVKIRQRLMAATREQLALRVKLDDAALDSIMRALKSDVELTLERVLAPAGARSPRR
jgi:RNA polymerase sigma-70 factor (ECF subfamily)